ncbi:MAG TPA: PorV/PorQ family protein [bacterium]|nr:PorV/PorQ family protein [bacterium]
MGRKSGVMGIFLLLAISLPLIVSTSSAGIFSKEKVGTTGATFLKIEAGARPVAMGGAFVAVADDANTIYWNPAGLALLEEREITAMHNEWLEGMRYEFLGYVQPIKSEKGTHGFGISAMGLYTTGLEQRTTETTEPEGTFAAYDIAVAGAYACKISRSISIGANAKLIHQKIESETAWGGAIDIGLIYRVPLRIRRGKFSRDKLQVGFAVQNIGPKIKFVKESDPLPLNIKAGIAKTYDLKSIKSELILACDVNAPIDNVPNGHFGVEFVYQKMKDIALAARAGYKTNTIKDLNALSGLSAGAGFVWKRMAVDYVWVPYGDLGNTHRISLTIRM